MKRIVVVGISVIGLLSCHQALAQNAAGSSLRKTSSEDVSDIENLLGRQPSTDLLWQVTERDLAYGLLDQAKKHLRQLVDRQDLTDEMILELREKHGTGLFIRVQRFPELAEIAKPLFDRLLAASKSKALDPQRIEHFISKLDDSASERTYAIEQLSLAGPYAIPFFIDAMKLHKIGQEYIIGGLMAMPTNSWPAIAASLDSGDEPMMSVMLDILAKMGEPRAAEFIYFVAGNPDYSDAIRTKATRTLSKLLGGRAQDLPSPASQLVQIAKKYDSDPEWIGLKTEIVPVWRWVGNNVEVTEMPVPLAAEYYGLRAVEQALQLTPDDKEAKIVFLKLSLDTSTARNGIDRTLPAGTNGALETSLGAGADLMASVLDEAINERRTAVALAAVRALGKTASPSQVQGDTEHKSPVVAALDYPNSRVRYAAAIAALEIHPDHSYGEADRVVDTLAQAIDTTTRPAVMVLDSDLARGNETAAVFGRIGYEPLVATTGKSGFEQATRSGLVELLVVDAALRDPTVIDTITTFEKDGRTAGIPTVVIAREPLPDVIERELKQFDHIVVMAPIKDPQQLSDALSLSLSSQTLAPWSEEERNANRNEALDWLVRIARGELEYLDPRPAMNPLLKLLNEEGLADRAAEALSYMPSAQVQEELAATALDNSLSTPMRAASAKALARNISRGSNALSKDQTKRLFASLKEESDPQLRVAIARVVGTVDRDGKTASDRFREYNPTLEPVEPPASSTDQASP